MPAVVLAALGCYLTWYHTKRNSTRAKHGAANAEMDSIESSPSRIYTQQQFGLNGRNYVNATINNYWHRLSRHTGGDPGQRGGPSADG